MLFMSIGCALYEFVEENGIKVHSAVISLKYSVTVILGTVALNLI